MRRAVVLLVVVATAAGAAAVAFAAQSPSALRASIFAAARREHSVHYVDVGAARGISQRMVGDVAATKGIQRISFKLGGKAGRFTVLVVGRRAYLQGDVFALHGYLGFSSRQATRYHGHWISIPPTSARYKSFAASVTLPSFLTDIYPGGSPSLVTTTVGGTQITGVRGTNRQEGLKQVVAVFPGPQPSLLPEAVGEVDPKHGFIDATRLSRWDEPVHVRAPANPVPIATVLAG